MWTNRTLNSLMTLGYGCISWIWQNKVSSNYRRRDFCLVIKIHESLSLSLPQVYLNLIFDFSYVVSSGVWTHASLPLSMYGIRWIRVHSDQHQATQIKPFDSLSSKKKNCSFSELPLARFVFSWSVNLIDSRYFVDLVYSFMLLTSSFQFYLLVSSLVKLSPFDHHITYMEKFPLVVGC